MNELLNKLTTLSKEQEKEEKEETGGKSCRISEINKSELIKKVFS